MQAGLGHHSEEQLRCGRVWAPVLKGKSSLGRQLRGGDKGDKWEVARSEREKCGQSLKSTSEGFAVDQYRTRSAEPWAGK